MFPFIFIEYMVLSLPLTAVFIVLNKVLKASAYEQNLIKWVTGLVLIES